MAMEAALKQRLTSRNLWTRAIYMVLFFVAYLVAEFILTVLVIFQFLVILLTGQANEPLLKLGNNLSTYVYQILQFVTFNSEEQPFPFAAWPDDEPGDSRWISDELPDKQARNTHNATPTPAADTTESPAEADPAGSDASRTSEPNKD